STNSLFFQTEAALIPSSFVPHVGSLFNQAPPFGQSQMPITQQPPLPPIGQPPAPVGTQPLTFMTAKTSNLAPGGPIASSGYKPEDTTSMCTVFLAPRRPGHGIEGRPVVLRANHFQVRIPGGVIQHYEISVSPEKCPRRVNREIVNTMVRAYGRIFGQLKPVYDGKKNMYTRDPLPIGKDKVSILRH
uniref:Protein argonaute N-terminal domain-containing protein n=1 Tax=Romanomermis culicivorax TaxID=13658 RepID=A0A915KP56_ROMCU